MILLLTAVVIYNARTLARDYYHAKHWVKSIVPSFLCGVCLSMLMEVLANAVFFGTSIWWPDWKCPAFRWINP